MDDYQMARLALDAVRTAARLAQQEQRRRERNRRQSANGTVPQGGLSRAQGQAQMQRQGQAHSPGQHRQQSAPASGGDRNELQRRPEFNMPENAGGEIPDEFLPQV